MQMRLFPHVIDECDDRPMKTTTTKSLGVGHQQKQTGIFSIEQNMQEPAPILDQSTF